MTDREAESVAHFLVRYPPFQHLTGIEAADLAADATLVAVPTGTRILEPEDRKVDSVWIVWTGRVALLHADDGSRQEVAIESLGVGAVFGFSALLSGGSVGFTAQASEDSTVYRLSGTVMREVLARPSGLEFLGNAISVASATSHVSLVERSTSRAVSDLVTETPVVAPVGATVREAAQQMTVRRSSYILMRCEDGRLGIFTDRDLRSRVVAAGIGLDTSVKDVMTVPAVTVTPDRLAATVLMDMLETGIRHVPVVTERGEIIGVLDDADLLAASTRRSFILRRSIALATDEPMLSSAAQGLPRLVGDMFRGGTEVSAISGILSVVIDCVVRRALELELSTLQPPVAETGLAWMTLGSIARREAMLSSDVDSALSWSPDLDSSAQETRLMAGRVHAVLDMCGLPADSNGAVASSARFARSVTRWRSGAAGWLNDPLGDRGIVMSSLMVDGRVVWGNRDLNPVPEVYRTMATRYPDALRLQLREALAGRARMRSLRDILARRGGTFDIKTHAVSPIVNLARWAGLSVGIASASTPARLAGASGNGLLSDGDASALTEVFGVLQRLRLTHQLEHIAAGQHASDVVAMAALSPLERGTLTESVREIAAVQRRVSYLAVNVGVPLVN